MTQTGTLQPQVTRPSGDRALIFGGLFAYLALLGVGWWAVINILPDQISVQLLGKTFALGELHRRILSNALMIFAILPFIFWLECLIVGWARSSTRQLIFARTPSVDTDLAVFVLGQARILGLVGRLMMLGASMISGMWLHDLMSAELGLTIDPTGLPLALQVLAYFFAYTFFDYWTHRLDHSRYFWPLHRYHHSAEDFCILSSGRQHPAAFTPIFIINMPLAALGATPEVLIYVNVAVTALGLLIHSKISSDWGWIGRYVIQSPVHHRAHHKLDMTTPTGHFAICPIWDHLFGTWRGAADPSEPIGVDTPYRHSLWIAPDMVRDYWHFWKGLVGR